MIRWTIATILLLVADPIAILLAPLLPLFCREEFGSTDNGNGYDNEPRLPVWLAWFQTPDNSLLGDTGHKQRWQGRHSYWQMVAWLVRNRLYGLRWSLLSATVDHGIIHYQGNPGIKNRNNGVSGVLRVQMGAYWQYKRVMRLWPGKCLQINLGWIIDPFIANRQKQGSAIFTSSIRISDFKE